MADVYANVGAILARALDVDIGPILDEIADEIESYAVGLAAEHVETGDFARSIQKRVDRDSPSGRDRFVFSDDPNVLSIEFGHQATDHEGKPTGAFVEGLHILQRAADAVHERI